MNPKVRPPMTEKARALATEHYAWSQGLARRVLRRRSLRRWEMDILSAAQIGLCHAACTFDAARGVKFRTLAYKRIRGEISDTLRMLTHGRSSTRLGKIRSAECMSPNVLKYMVAVPDTVSDSVDTCDLVDAVVRRAAPSRRAALEALLVTSTCREAGDLCGLSESMVSLHRSRAAAEVDQSLREAYR